MRKLLAAILAALMVTALAACGDDDDDDDLFSPTVTTQTATAASTEPTPSATAPAATSSPDDGDDDDDAVDLVLFYPRLTDTDFELVEVERRIDDTPRVAAAALELLIEGPTEAELDSLDISDPIPEGTELLSLNIDDDGLATADFSEELADFGGGSLNVRTIVAMITETLKQFPTVEDVVILVEGDADVLEP